MARVFVTGSSQRLRLMAAERLAAQGHEVLLHARDATRAEAARRALPAAASVLVADVSTTAAMRSLADQAKARDLRGTTGWYHPCPAPTTLV